MSETGEIPQDAQLELSQTSQEQEQLSLEDMEEFKKLTPEQQNYLLDMQERIRAEAMDPQAVVTRSIDEMGFWDGMRDTMLPHLRKYKELKIKDLKACASLALSLIPVLGEGKGIGTGLFGIATKDGSAFTKATNFGNISFEPAARLSKAMKAGKDTFLTARRIKTVNAVGRMADAEKIMGGLPKVGFGIRIKESFAPIKAALAGKNEAIGVLGKEFSDAASHGATVMATKLGVERIQAAQEAGKLAEKTAYLAKKVELTTDAIKNRRWFDLPRHWKASGIERAAKRASKDARKIAKGSMNMVLEPRFANRKLIPGQKWIESQAVQAVPKVIEGTKFGKFHAFFDRWLNLTPDVPVWLSTTTGVMEFLGAHGIDAIPAVLQLGKNAYEGAKLTKQMAGDVLAYTAKRGLQKVLERQQAAAIFEKSVEATVAPAAA